MALETPIKVNQCLLYTSISNISDTLFSQTFVADCRPIGQIKVDRKIYTIFPYTFALSTYSTFTLFSFYILLFCIPLFLSSHDNSGDLFDYTK